MADASMTEAKRQTRKERQRRRKLLQKALHSKNDEPIGPAGETNADRPAADSRQKQAGRILASELTGLKYFEKLAPLLAPLHAVACERDPPGNRQLHYDQFCLLLLLALFNPVAETLRALEQASELEKVQKRLKVGRAARSCLSEAARVFDAELLKPILAELGEQLQPLGRDPRLVEVRRTLTLVDGTLLAALPQMAEAMWLKHLTGSGLVKWRLHTHFEVQRHVPTRIDVTPNGGGEYDERAVLEKCVEPDHCYVMDRGYAKFALFNTIHAADSSYVCRLRDNSSYEIVQEYPLTEADRAAQIVFDGLVEFGATSRKDARPDHPIRLVIVKVEPHEKRGKTKSGSTGPGSDGYLRIATDLLDAPAEIIGLIFLHRWSVELFFRFFKQILGCRRLFFHNQNGIEIQAYCAIIACMLISLWTGRKPSRRTYEMICYYFLGLASEEELLRHLSKLEAQDKGRV